MCAVKRKMHYYLEKIIIFFCFKFVCNLFLLFLAKGKKLDATQEMFALGICNTIGAFVSSMPVTGSFTRSAVNNASGVRTTLAGIFTSGLLLLSIAFLTPSFYFVPKATLAAIIICAMIYLFDWGAFSVIWRTKSICVIPVCELSKV